MTQSLDPLGFQHVEIMGHQRVAGYVEPRAFGGAVLLHVTMPARDPEEQTLEAGRWINERYCGAGSRIRITRHAVDQYIGIPSVFRMTACTEESAIAWQPSEILILELVLAPAQLTAGVRNGEEEELEAGDDGDDFEDGSGVPRL